ncbi:Tautomerase enzyme [Bradyrhizobium sediminis]|uniref:Tautomerase enzyme n=1 Tax=Bradyrhizobium sediminis TaxID=2840469 RepID=A0A975RT55_9BRAD|nr:Tautomerase enzyme [Bradyrhizobium sediminis]QWG19290.1 Tautomerase enzyme [Bradyrhizobium sediminis]
MPMVDVLIPQGALKPDAEARLLSELTDILITLEGFEATNQRARDVTVIYLHRPAEVYVAGARATSPRYRIIPTVPEGQYTEEIRKAVVKQMTEAVARAEGGTVAEVGPRVWVFPTELPDGHWGSRGVIRPLPDIQAFIAGEHERKVGEERIARTRRNKALAMLEGALDAARIGVGGR